MEKIQWRITQVENESKAKTQVEGRHEPLLDLAVLRIYIRRFFSKHFVLCCVASVSVALYFDPFFDPPELEVTAMHLCAHVEATSFKGGGLNSCGESMSKGWMEELL